MYFATKIGQQSLLIFWLTGHNRGFREGMS
jgi:hypothetical protein